MHNLKKLSFSETGSKKILEELETDKENVNVYKKNLVVKLNTDYERVPSKKYLKTSNLLNASNDEATKQIDNFDDILKFLATPTNINVQTTNNSSTSDLASSINSQSSQKSIDGMTFEEVLEKMLAPDLISAEKQTNYILKKEQLKSCRTNNTKGVEMTIEELMDRMLAKDFEPNNSGERVEISQKMSEESGASSSQTCFEVVSENSNLNANNDEKQKLEENPNIDTQQGNLFENGMDFEELLSQSLTPSTQTQIPGQKNSKEVCTQMSKESGARGSQTCPEVVAENSDLNANNVEKQELEENLNIDSQQGNLFENEMDFEELLSQSLTPSTQTQISEQKNSKEVCTQMSEESGAGGSRTSPEVVSENSDLLANNVKKQKLEENVNIGTQQGNLFENEMDFEELLSQSLTPSTQTQISGQKNSKEICTQTSFDLAPIRLECSCTSLNEISFDNHATAVAERSSSKKVGQKLNNRKNQIGDQSLEQENFVNILDILSRDVTTLPDGCKFFNNISKIGTPEWLQSALTLADSNNLTIPKQNKRELTTVKLLEVQNTLDMYINDSTKPNLKFIQKGITRIYKIDKTGTSEDSSGFGYYEEIQSDLEEATEAEQKLKLAIDEVCKDKDLISDKHNIKVIDKNKIRTKIHSIFLKLYEIFANNQNPHLVLRRAVLKGCVYKNGRYQCGPLNKAPLSTIRFKSKCKKFSYKFCRFLYLLGKAYSLLENNTKLTTREIFYQCKHLVKSQRVMDTIIEEVSRLLGVGHWHLNIISQKGLVYGNMKLIWASGEITDCNSPATAVPPDVEGLLEVHSTAYFILVVEKESIYHKLLEEDIPNKLVRPFIMITGKGMPSFNTRLFVNTLSNMMSIPVFILVDADIHGIKIMMTYRFGSAYSCHLSDQLAIPKARWLGVFPSEITKYGMQQQNLTRGDRTTITSLLKYPVMDSYPRIKEEIEILANANKKASIEGLIKNNTFLSETYLPVKFLNKDFI